MKILILGGNGHVGTRLTLRLNELGHDTLVASRTNGVDAVTGAGLGDAMAGVDVVVDVLNTVDMDPAAATAFFRGSTERVLAAEHTTGVRHHVLLSVVGADRALANGYYVGKVAQEEAVRDGGIPFTIVRAKQFHDFIP
ncbi:SDR family oxidoreductase, partial [Curtobacterium sp. B18]|uniref:SDR family oxidoreductase n=1 Tax=Curtobacterium sp. B18 TaxID=95614 RepID=UPI0003B6400A